MGSQPENTQATAIIARAKGIIVNPAGEWAKVAGETDQPMQVFLRYVLPLAAIGPVAGFIGMQLFGISILGFTMRFTFTQALSTAIISLVMALIGVWVVAFVANLLSPKFGGKDDLPSAFRLVAYSWTAAWLAGIFQLLPNLGIIGMVAALYSFYLLYKGTSPVMAVPQDKSAVYTIVTVLAAVAAMFVASMVVNLFSPVMNPAADVMPGQISIEMG